MEVLEDLLVTIQEVVQQVLLQIIQGQLHKDILQDKDIVTKQITPTVAVEVELVLLGGQYPTQISLPELAV